MSLEPAGVLDTSTLILLGDFPDETGLPAVPAITTVTLAELGVPWGVSANWLPVLRRMQHAAHHGAHDR